MTDREWEVVQYSVMASMKLTRRVAVRSPAPSIIASKTWRIAGELGDVVSTAPRLTESRKLYNTALRVHCRIRHDEYVGDLGDVVTQFSM